MGAGFGSKMGWDVENEWKSIGCSGGENTGCRIFGFIDGHFETEKSMTGEMCHVRTVPSRITGPVERDVNMIEANVSSWSDIDDSRYFRVGGVYFRAEVVVDGDLYFSFPGHLSL